MAITRIGELVSSPERKEVCGTELPDGETETASVNRIERPLPSRSMGKDSVKWIDGFEIGILGLDQTERWTEDV